MFKIGLSRDINKDSFNCDLNALFSFKSIGKLSKLAYDHPITDDKKIILLTGLFSNKLRSLLFNKGGISVQTWSYQCF